MSKRLTSADSPENLTARRGYHHGNLREALIEAARRLTAEKGPQGFTMIEASRMAGVSAAAPYRHFPDQAALVAEVRKRGFEAFGKRLREAYAAGAEPQAAFSAMGGAYLGFAREEPGYYAAMFSDPAAAAPSGPPEAGSFGMLISGVTGLEQKGVKLKVSPRLVSLHVWIMTHGVAALEAAGQLPRGPGVPSAEEILRSGVDALIRGQSLPATDA